MVGHRLLWGAAAAVLALVAVRPSIVSPAAATAAARVLVVVIASLLNRVLALVNGPPVWQTRGRGTDRPKG
jgi:hypothetical protein